MRSHCAPPFFALLAGSTMGGAMLLDDSLAASAVVDTTSSATAAAGDVNTSGPRRSGRATQRTVVVDASEAVISDRQGRGGMHLGGMYINPIVLAALDGSAGAASASMDARPAAGTRGRVFRMRIRLILTYSESLCRHRQAQAGAVAA